MKTEEINTLFVEDSPGDARLIQELLSEEKRGLFRVTRAVTLEETLDKLSNTRFDVVILDLNLPDSAGLETYSKVQKHHPALPVVVLTGYDDQQFATLALQQGAQDYLVKGSVGHGLLVRSLLYAIERKRIEERLRRLNEELEQRVTERTVELTNFVGQLEHEIAVRKRAERTKDEFLSMVSHELRTPLSIAKEGIDLLLDRVPGEINAKQERVLSLAKRNMDRLGRIINNLLNISRMETGRLQMKLETIDFCELIHELHDTFQKRAHEKGIRIQVETEQDSIMIQADRDGIMEVLTNITDNAIKFTQRGGVRLSVEDHLDTLQCIIADTGVGIPSESLPKIFDKFEQFHRDIIRGEKGTGLGLAISRDIIEWHGGSIWVDSEPNKGTTFTFRLPKAPSRPVSRTGGREERQPVK
ncbi:MAG: hybrid sensor histidine kinase/response regulator [Candidatus Pacebacteria bacterium]|nr:hybrid sensor histidine kinase/response regulator [Candidatus Paceibacterota bacterium]